MKFPIVTLVLLLSSLAQAKSVKDFNKVLIQDVQKDLATDNDQRLKTREVPMRAPASVVETAEDGKSENERVEKGNVRQTGMQKW